jgi:hypothetical protein
MTTWQLAWLAVFWAGAAGWHSFSIIPRRKGPDLDAFVYLRDRAVAQLTGTTLLR